MLSKQMAYEKWFGIRRQDQPPTLYRLLGVEAFEADPDITSYAADSRMALLRQFQIGDNAPLAEEILNELSNARVTLLNPEKKSAYDARLRQRLTAQSAMVGPPQISATSSVPPLPVAQSLAGPRRAAQAPPTPPGFDLNSLALDFRPTLSTTPGRQKKLNPLVWIAPALGFALVLVTIAAMNYFSGSQDSSTIAPQIAAKPSDTLKPTAVHAAVATKALIKDGGLASKPSSNTSSHSSLALPDTNLASGEAAHTNKNDRPEWHALADTDAVFRQYWKPGGTVFYDQASKTIRVRGLFELGSLNYKHAWDTVCFEIAAEDIRPGSFHIVVNGITLEIGKSLPAGIQFVPAVIRYDQIRGTVEATIAGSVVETATVLDKMYGNNLSLIFRHENWTGTIQLRNIWISPNAFGQAKNRIETKNDMTQPAVAVNTASGDIATEGKQDQKPDVPEVSSNPPAVAPAPDASAQAEAMKLIKEVYGDEWAAAKTADQKQALAKKLLQKSKETEKDHSAQYVLLRLSRDIATQALDEPTSFEAIDELNRLFQINALDMKAAELTKAASIATTTQQHMSVAEEASELSDRANVTDTFPVAKQLNELALGEARKSRDTALIKRVVERTVEIEEVAKTFEAAEKSMETLAKVPLDPEANLTVGKYKCFVKGDWKTGLAMLALGSDKTLKTIADTELSVVTASDEQAKLGDSWWNLAETQNGIAKRRIQERAGYWYRTALSGLTGLAKDKVAKRLSELPSAPIDGGSIGGEASGPSSKINQATEDGLRWLVAQQQNDGGWNLNVGTNPSNLQPAPAAATAMAILPLLRAGHSHMEREHGKAIQAGIAFIEHHLKFDEHGCQTTDIDGSMYGNALVTIALCEAIARTHDQKLRPTAQAAVNFIIYAQNPDTGGWRYKPRDIGDTSVVGWQLQALKAAAQAKIKFPPQTLAMANRFLNSTELEDGGSYSYQPNGAGAPPTTAVGLFCRIVTGGSRQLPGFSKGVQSIAALGPSTAPGNIYYDHYGTLLMHAVGGQQWKTWSEAMQKKLLESQATEGPNTGSWFFQGGSWSDHLGRLGSTSFCLMMLNELKDAQRQ